jgi:hypothetical protein
MKKVYSLLLFVLAINGLAFSQVCTPAVVSANGIFPDSATNFLPAYQNSYYEQIITVKVPADTALLPPPLPPVDIDSTKMVSLTGLPTGLTYACVPPTCGFPGGQTSCAKISGTTSDPVGTYNLNIVVEAYISGLSTPAVTETLTYYKIVVNPPSSLANNANNIFAFTGFNPNPANTSTNVTFTSAQSSEVSLRVFNAIGASVAERRVAATAGKNAVEISTQELPSGIYFITLSQSGKMLTNRMVVAH